MTIILAFSSLDGKEIETRRFDPERDYLGPCRWEDLTFILAWKIRVLKE